MTVGIVGSGRAADAVEAMLESSDIDTTPVDVTGIGGVTLAVVTGQAGDSVFERTNERALKTGTRWVGVEIGGVGGIPIVDAAVAGFGPDSGCYECLSGRVSANLEPQADPAAAPPAHTARFAGAVGGREAARYVTDGVDIFGRAVMVPFTEREFLPLPNCQCVTTRDRTLDRAFRSRDIEESLARAQRAVDEVVGVVQEVGEAESFPIPYYLAQACDTAGFSHVSAARDAAGVAPDWNEAFMKALGESLERYCAGVYRVDNLRTARASELPDGVGPSAFVCEHTPEPDAEIYWTRGQHLASRSEVKLPAEFVYHPPPSRAFRSPVTTGLGLGNSTVEALLSGLYEVVERDAMMLSWYSSFDPLALAVEEPDFETMVQRARSEGLEVTTFLLTQDIDVPVVAAAVHREEWPRFALGTGADLDPAGAARSALAEALQNWMELRGMGADDAAEAMGAIGRYAADPDPVSPFVGADAEIPAGTAGPDEIESGVAELQELLDRIHAAETEMDVYGAKTTTRGVEQLGFEAVRALIPQAQPLTFGSAYFGDRARTVPEALGFEPELDRDHHPFP